MSDNAAWDRLVKGEWINQQWRGWAKPIEVNDSWSSIETADRTARMMGADTPVIIVEDEHGDYLGWLDAKRSEDYSYLKDANGNPDLDLDSLTMIQHRRVFNIQFAYGYKAEEEMGRGKAMRLSIHLDPSREGQLPDRKK